MEASRAAEVVREAEEAEAKAAEAQSDKARWAKLIVKTSKLIQKFQMKATTAAQLQVMTQALEEYESEEENELEVFDDSASKASSS